MTNKQETKPTFKTRAAECAHAIKALLKSKYPTIKFSVKSDTFSMGDAVRISWTDGPTTKQIDDITNPYQMGSFDGMTDMYEYSNRNENLPQTKYITTSRNMSDATSETLKTALSPFFEGWGQDSHSLDNFIYRFYVNWEIPEGATLTGVERTEANAGQYTDLLRPTFEYSTIETQAAATPEAPELSAGEIALINYSPLSIAVIGATKEIKEDLKSMGGRFNFRLSCGAGWIFPKSKQDEIIVYLKTLKAEQDKTTTELKDEIQKTVDFFAKTDIKMIGEISENTRQIAAIQHAQITLF